MRTRQLLELFLPPALWAAVLFAVSAQPSVPGPSIGGLDKVAHFVAYGVLGYLCARSAGGASPSSLSATVIGAAVASAYGVTDEWHQSFVPGRTPEALDLVADALGACAGAAAWYALGRRVRARSKREAP